MYSVCIIQESTIDLHKSTCKESLSSCCNLPPLHIIIATPSLMTQGYKQRKCFVVTQAPLDNTVLDFWKMAKDLESRTIVLLCNLTENGKVHFTIIIMVCCAIFSLLTLSPL